MDDAKTSAYLSGAYANNWLTGNGAADFRFLETDYSSINTIPDITWDQSPSLTFNFTHAQTDNLSFSANVYYRYVRTDSTSGDLNEESFGENLYDLSPDDVAALTAAGYSDFPITGDAATEPYPYWLSAWRRCSRTTAGECPPQPAMVLLPELRTSRTPTVSQD